MVLVTYGVLALFFGAMIVSAPLPNLLDRFIPDDAFYYFNTAKIFATTGFSSFDGIHFTNGYQPLWFLLSTLFFLLFPDGGELPLRLLLLVQIILSAGATVLLVASLVQLFGTLNAAIGGVIWLLVFQRVMINGLETSLVMFLYALLFYLFLNYGEIFKKSFLFVLGLICSLLFLARTDMVFLVLTISLFLFVKRYSVGETWMEKIINGSYFAGPIIVIGSCYILSNLYLADHWMPVSGAAKVFYSTAGRQRMIEEVGSVLLVYLRNMGFALLETRFHYVLAGLLGPVALIALSEISYFKRILSPFRRLWPFYLAAILSYLFYTSVFYGGFSRTLWYFGPQVFLASAAIAGFSAAIHSIEILRPTNGLMGILLLALILGWINPLSMFLIALIAPLIYLIRCRNLPITNTHRLILLCIVAVGALVVLSSRPINIQLWIMMTVASLLLVGVVEGSEITAVRVVFTAGILLLSTSIIHFQNLRNDLTLPPGNWNYNLYLGALWVRDQLPEDATIWAGSAGILGYFSGRTVVNTDGLANDYDFLENYLEQGKRVEYLRKWQYGIDAFPESWTLDWISPDGCFIPLPEEVTQYPFEDGDSIRSLGIYQMDRVGKVDCELIRKAPGTEGTS